MSQRIDAYLPSDGTVYRIPWSGVLLCGLLYLLLPNLFFLNEVFRPLYAVPLSLFLLVGAGVIWVQVKRTYRPAINCTATDLVALGVSVVVALILLECCGINGHVPQNIDHGYRNAMYDTLVYHDWPFFSEQGDSFIYYHAFWLPPAFLAKCAGSLLPREIFLYTWALLGFLLFLLAAFSRFKRYVLVFICVTFLLGNITELILAGYEVNNVLADKMPWLTNHINPYSTPLYADRLIMRFTSVWGCTVSICYNAGIPSLVMMGILISGLLPLRYWFFPVAMMCSMNPCGVVGLIPLLLLTYLARPSQIKMVLLNPFFWGTCALAGLCVVYYSGQEQGAEFFWIWDKPATGRDFVRPHAKAIRVISMSLSIILPAWLLLRRRLRRNLWFAALMVSSIVLPLIWYGRSDNILAAKASFCFYVLFAALLTMQWRHSSCVGRWLLSLFVLLSGVHVYGFILKNHYLTEYSWQPDVVQSHFCRDWGSSLNRMQGSMYYHNFFGKVKSEQLQYTRPGESLITRMLQK